MRRVLLGLVSVGGLTILTLNALDGAFHWRGATIRAGEPGFWFLIIMNGAVFTGLLLLAISGRGFDAPRK